MGNFTFEYADVSADPRARFWADVPAELRRELARLDFESLGYAHAFQPRTRAHMVHEVQVSSDARTQAVLNAYAPQAELVTLFEDGSIVKTQQRPPLSTWLLMSPGMGGHRDDLVFHEAVPGDVGALVRRHDERIDSRERNHGIRPVAMDSMCAHFAVRFRTLELLSARLPTQFTLSACLAIASQVVAALWIFRIALRRFGPETSRVWVALLAGLGGIITMLGVFQLTLYWIAPYLLRLRRGPSPATANVLLERAAAVPEQPLPGD